MALLIVLLPQSRRELGAKADLLRRLAICPLSGGMCYKTIFTTKLSNVDSRRAGAQHRSRLQPGGFLISSAKRLIHQFKHWHFKRLYLPVC